MNARELAVYTLINIIEQKSYNNLSLKKVFSENKEISSQDRAFITELVNGTLRNIIYIDYVINSFSKTKTKKMKPLILNILRISVYQLQFMDKIPSSATCNEAVNFVKKKKINGLAGFVNGVLRNIDRAGKDIVLPNEKENPVEFLSIKYSYQEWIIKKMLMQMTYDEVKAMCESNSIPPRVSICVNTIKTSREQLKDILEKEGMIVECGKITENSLYIGKTGNIADSDAFKKGLFHIMDESSMCAIDTLEPSENDIIIDLCASPAGKTFYSSYLTNANAEIIARDIHPHKIELMEVSKSRLGLYNVVTQLKDATIFYEEDEETADKLIVDAPCSGFGIVRKKPDIKYNKQEDDIKELVNLQREILKNSYRYLKKGGILLYSTCTIFDEENIENVLWFCENYNFELVSINSENIKNIDSKSAEKGYLNIYPNMFNTDGFFIAKLRRK